MRPILAASLLPLLAAGCAVNPEAQRQAELRTEQELAVTLAGRTAGTPLRCIPNYRATQMEVVDDRTFLYRDGKTIYLQRPRAPCTGLANRSFTLVTKQYGTNQLCSGDISQLVDLRTGMQGGACVFGDFVPYTKP
ncbi:hypothetical protein [Sphingomonas jaspsi]|uniref:hypothetical protein n=1 Tax=Sphingomonas jaspsi TaxID=392409 RepID=UPI0012EC09A2|nr:hypothetical protein [Sphingomonas jaspsi]